MFQHDSTINQLQLQEKIVTLLVTKDCKPGGESNHGISMETVKRMMKLSQDHNICQGGLEAEEPAVNHDSELPNVQLPGDGELPNVQLPGDGELPNVQLPCDGELPM